jgi:toxin secretion/phage lysis holin
MNNNVCKVITAIISTVTGILSSLLGILYIPVLLMVACNLIDYGTGLMAAKYRNDGKISSYRSMRGILKKVCQWLLVIVGSLIDMLLKYSATTIGFKMPFTFMIACIVAIWIICNEIISILENMIDIGAPIPPFLIQIIKNVKTQVENIGGTTEESEEKQNE